MKFMKFMKSFSIICLIIISILTYSVLTQDQPSNDNANGSVTSNDNATSTTSNDNAASTTLNNNVTFCPPPLIIISPNEFEKAESQNCIGDCCLACPFSYNFYEKNKIENTFKGFAILGIISFSLMFILAIIFIKFPSQKQNALSKLILLPLTLSVMIFEGSEFFSINQRQSQCNDLITPADKSNKYCAAQAFFTLGGGFAIACYSALLMSHLHLISVWRVEFISNKIAYFHFLIVGASLAAFLIPYIYDLIQSTGICFISLDEAPVFFYSLTFIYIAFIAHLTTFIHMAHISIKSNKRHSTMSRVSIIEAQRKLFRLKTIINVHWRSLLGSLLMLIIYVLNWYYYIFELRPLSDPVLSNPWIYEWVNCLHVSNGDQDLCAEKFSSYTPNYNFIFTLLFFNRTAGILIFIIFAAKKSVLLDIFDLLGIRKNEINTNVNISYYEGNRTSSIGKRKLSIRNSNNVTTNDVKNLRYSAYSAYSVNKKDNTNNISDIEVISADNLDSESSVDIDNSSESYFASSENVEALPESNFEVMSEGFSKDPVMVSNSRRIRFSQDLPSRKEQTPSEGITSTSLPPLPTFKGLMSDM